MKDGKDAWGGLAPSQARKDVPKPPHWRKEMAAAVDRPHHLEVSPDGAKLAFILDRGDLGSDVWIMDDTGSAPTQLTVDRPPLGFWEDSPAEWSPDGSSIVYVADGWVRVVASSGGPSKPVIEGWGPTWFDDSTLVVGLDSMREHTGNDLPTVTEVSRLGLVDVSDPWARPVTGAEADAAAPVSHAAALAYVTYPPDDRNRSDVVVLDTLSGERRTVSAVEGMHSASPQWSPDGSMLAFVSEQPGWYQVFVDDASGVRQLTEGDGDISEVRWSADGVSIAATRSRWGRSHLVVIDVATGAVTILAEGGVWAYPAWLTDGSIVAVYEDHATPARIERIDVEGTRHTLFDPTPLSVKVAPHIRPEEVTFPGLDGLDIHGFLFRPDREKPVPAVVYPHGGPTSAYFDDWDGYAQYFLDKGYAWFAVNFRGSTTYGRDFERANHGVWGVDDTADCLAAADYLASLDWVDGDRLAIFGASYGSYMALAALVDDPAHRYACGVAKFGDCDILTSWAQGDRLGIEDLERMMGHPSTARAEYRAGSPIHRLDAIQRPILVAHGEKDERVHPRQSEQLVKELERLGKTYEYVTYPTEGHGFHRRGPQLDFYNRLERFLDWYLM